MKSRAFILLTVATFFIATNTFAESLKVTKKLTVIIDPGHGGKDFGCSYKSYIEKNMTLIIGKKICSTLQKRGINSVTTRASDVKISLQDRALFANFYENSVFISLHVNSFKDTSVSGIIFFYYKNSDKQLATILRKNFKEFEMIPSKIKTGRLYILKHVNSPSVLVELGYITNYMDRFFMSSEQCLNILINNIVKGIEDYLIKKNDN